jgi:hypothetical protein
VIFDSSIRETFKQTEIMNIATGQSARKEHLINGSRTACNRKISFGKSGKAEFKLLFQTHPELCCSKCSSKLK